jgi:hypothetical protein
MTFSRYIPASRLLERYSKRDILVVVEESDNTQNLLSKLDLTLYRLQNAYGNQIEVLIYKVISP